MRLIVDANVAIGATTSRGLGEAIMELCLEHHQLVLGEGSSWRPNYQPAHHPPKNKKGNAPIHRGEGRQNASLDAQGSSTCPRLLPALTQLTSAHSTPLDSRKGVLR